MGNSESSEGRRSHLATRKIKKYGWVPDIPDIRDIWITIPPETEKVSYVDLRKYNLFPNVWNQGNLGSCVSHAVLAAYMYDLNKRGVSNFNPSKQFIYYNQRLIMGTTKYDSGSSIRDAIKVINSIGVCQEENYPYDVDFFTDAPNEDAYTNALMSINSKMLYKRLLPNTDSIIKILNNKIPIIFGFTVYESFEHPDVTRTGMMPIPRLSEKIVGSHCALIIGYDNNRKFFLCRNSWGQSWGYSGGYFWMPFAFVNPKNCSDFWVMYTTATSTTATSTHTSNIQKVKQSNTPEVEKVTDIEFKNESDSEPDDV